MSQMQAFDCVVLGGGSGGLAMAKRAADLGARVALLEPAALGGTCVHRGCVPKKILWNAAEVARHLGHAADYGWPAPAAAPFDWAGLARKRAAYLERLRGIYAGQLAQRGIVHLPAAGQLEGNGRVRAGAHRLHAPHIVIATGGAPYRPEVPGAGLGLTSDDFFAMPALPARVAVVGAGYIAVELASVLAALGSAVTLFVRGDRLLRNFDDRLGEALAAAFEQQGIGIRFRHALARLERQADGRVAVIGADGARASFDALFWATGRVPNLADIGLDRVGLAPDDQGVLRVDADSRTAAPGIHAIGDVTGEPALTPVAIAAGRRLSERLFGHGDPPPIDPDTVPSVVFTHPPVASVGLSEARARERHGAAVRVHESAFVPLYHAMTEDKPRTLVKLITTGAEERVVGLHMLGPGVDEVLQGFAVAIRMGATKADFDHTIAIHPTTAEEVVTLR